MWVPDEKEGYLAGWVNKEDGGFGDIIMAAGGEVSGSPSCPTIRINSRSRFAGYLCMHC